MNLYGAPGYLFEGTFSLIDKKFEFATRFAGTRSSEAKARGLRADTLQKDLVSGCVWAWPVRPFHFLVGPEQLTKLSETMVSDQNQNVDSLLKIILYYLDSLSRPPVLQPQVSDFSKATAKPYLQQTESLWMKLDLSRQNGMIYQIY